MIKYNKGDIINLEAIPDKGYMFRSWLVDGKAIPGNTNLKYKVTKNATISALFEPETIEKNIKLLWMFNPQLKENPQKPLYGSFDIEGKDTAYFENVYSNGEKVTITVKPKQILDSKYFYIFTGWDDITLGPNEHPENPRTFTATTTKNYTANMRIMPEVMFVPEIAMGGIDNARAIINYTKLMLGTSKMAAGGPFEELYTAFNANQHEIPAYLWEYQLSHGDKLGRAYIDDMLRVNKEDENSHEKSSREMVENSAYGYNVFILNSHINDWNSCIGNQEFLDYLFNTLLTKIDDPFNNITIKNLGAREVYIAEAVWEEERAKINEATANKFDSYLKQFNSIEEYINATLLPYKFDPNQSYEKNLLLKEDNIELKEVTNKHIESYWLDKIEKGELDYKMVLELIRLSITNTK